MYAIDIFYLIIMYVMVMFYLMIMNVMITRHLIVMYVRVMFYLIIIHVMVITHLVIMYVMVTIYHIIMYVSFHNFKSQNLKLSVSNPKNKYVAYLPVLSQISNCQSLGRKNKHDNLKADRININNETYT